VPAHPVTSNRDKVKRMGKISFAVCFSMGILYRKFQDGKVELGTLNAASGSEP